MSTTFANDGDDHIHLTALEVVRLEIHKLRWKEITMTYLTMKEKRKLLKLQHAERRILNANSN